MPFPFAVRWPVCVQRWLGMRVSRLPGRLAAFGVPWPSLPRGAVSYERLFYDTCEVRIPATAHGFHCPWTTLSIEVFLWSPEEQRWIEGSLAVDMGFASDRTLFVRFHAPQSGVVRLIAVRGQLHGPLHAMLPGIPWER